MDRRAVFFLGSAAICLSLLPLTPEKLRYVPLWLTAWYVLLAALSLLDHLSRRRFTYHDPVAPQPDVVPSD